MSQSGHHIDVSERVSPTIDTSTDNLICLRSVFPITAGICEEDEPCAKDCCSWLHCRCSVFTHRTRSKSVGPMANRVQDVLARNCTTLDGILASRIKSKDHTVLTLRFLRYTATSRSWQSRSSSVGNQEHLVRAFYGHFCVGEDMFKFLLKLNLINYLNFLLKLRDVWFKLSKPSRVSKQRAFIYIFAF